MAEPHPEFVPPPDVSDMREAAHCTFGMFNAYVEAGFTEQQALYLVAQMLTSMLGSGGSSQ